MQYVEETTEQNLWGNPFQKEFVSMDGYLHTAGVWKQNTILTYFSHSIQIPPINIIYVLYSPSSFNSFHWSIPLVKCWWQQKMSIQKWRVNHPQRVYSLVLKFTKFWGPAISTRRSQFSSDCVCPNKSVKSSSSCDVTWKSFQLQSLWSSKNSQQITYCCHRTHNSHFGAAVLLLR
jgi:hypothetical protein